MSQPPVLAHSLMEVLHSASSCITTLQKRVYTCSCKGPSPAVVVKEPFAPNPCLTSPGAPAAITDAHQKERTDALLQHIKQLPAAPAERATLFALLNHLKKVAMHSTQNKMTCQNLAVCFGPVLLGPVNAGQRSG